MRLFDVHEPFETALDEDRRGSDGNNVVLWPRLVGQSCFHDLTGSHQPNARIRIEPSRTRIRALKDVLGPLGELDGQAVPLTSRRRPCASALLRVGADRLPTL